MTAFGFALPAVFYMTMPTSAPRTFALPALKRPTASVFAASTSSIAAPSAAVSVICCIPRAWTITRGMRAVEAAGAIHSDLEKHFIRAETIHWDQLLDAGSEAVARQKGTLRLEGKDYVVKDGDVMHIRHSG